MRLIVATRCRDEREVLPWFLANCRFADLIYVCDGSSQDGTWEYLQEAAGQDPRIRPLQWAEQPAFYQRQDEHYNFMLAPVRLEPPDWLFLPDADDIYSAAFQAGIRDWLGSIVAEPKTAVRETFYYLSPDCQSYYRELSRWSEIAARNFVSVAYREQTETQFAVESADHWRDLPADFCGVHFNYLMFARFARKRRHYEAKFGYPSWHPEQRFGSDKTPLPASTAWWSPDGRLLHVGNMRGVFA